MSKNLSAEYYQNNKERLRKKACGKCQSISQEENETKVTIWS